MRDVVVPQSNGTAERSPYLLASALRTLQVLQAFAVPPHRLGLAEVVSRLDLERNQAYRSLKTLEAAGFLVDAGEGRFEPGPAAAILATATVRFQSGSLLEVARPFLDDLSAVTSETVHLFVRTGDRAVCVDRRESTQSVRLMSVLGLSLPLHAGAVPKAILAWLPEAERNAVLQRLCDLPAYTERTVRDPHALAAELATTRERGYSLSDEDFDVSARGAGAAIFDGGGSVAAGLSVGGPSFRVDDATLEQFGRLVRAAAAAISDRLSLAGRS